MAVSPPSKEGMQFWLWIKWTVNTQHQQILRGSGLVVYGLSVRECCGQSYMMLESLTVQNYATFILLEQNKNKYSVLEQFEIIWTENVQVLPGLRQEQEQLPKCRWYLPDSQGPHQHPRGPQGPQVL